MCAEIKDPEVQLTPSPNGADCAGNGQGEHECCCDECGYFLQCYPDTMSQITDKNKKTALIPGDQSGL